MLVKTFFPLNSCSSHVPKVVERFAGYKRLGSCVWKVSSQFLIVIKPKGEVASDRCVVYSFSRCFACNV